ncbi:hypothetical protein ON010_g17331 [Phytophthora cinnamomi]|nr:hypothetical protein ON010_g17331 [Phytophthora cinnamomi]
MNSSKRKDERELYSTDPIVVRHAVEVNGIEEEIVLKKILKFIDGGSKDFLEWVYNFKQLAGTKHWGAEDNFVNPITSAGR